jgi:hypothetical protein
VDAFGHGRPDLAFPENLARHLHTFDLAAAAITDSVSAVVFKLKRIAHDGMNYGCDGRPGAAG